ncbi:MAG: Ig-like domain-containing protein [Clostridiales bacterium]|nr:Ig-like domain-containing protein [Clostridiales bacterium]
MIVAFLCIFSVTVCSAKAAAETTTVRVISTTDIHGKTTTTDYDSSCEHNSGSLAQAATLIDKARSEITYGSSITVDVGDSIYGYSADMVRSQGNTVVQPVYKAMKAIGYDALTLGNHDFDYGYQYVATQLEQAGLSSKCVLSNVYDVNTDQTVWNENLLITKTLETNEGNKVKVKIGIIGVTRPSLTNNYSHTGILKTADMLETVENQVSALRKQGADLIIVLAHCSFGNANPDYNSDSVAYAMTKVPGVTAIASGHAHKNFPSTDANIQSVYKLPNVNKTTGLVNGVPVVMQADKGAGIGVMDIKLKVSGKKVSVLSTKSRIRYVTSSTASSEKVLKSVQASDNLIKSSYSQAIANLAAAAMKITSNLGVLEDNYAIQLNNEAKIQKGLEYISSKEGSAYASYPVIASTAYYECGKDSTDNLINIGSQITWKDILTVQPYRRDVNNFYTITGSQLKEWMEYVASAFQQSGGATASKDTVLSSLSGSLSSPVLLKDEWLNDWSRFEVFDGVEYEFDLSKPAKYNYYGKVADSGTSRVKTLTYNGKPVTGGMQFLLVTNDITVNTPVIGSRVYYQRVKKNTMRSAEELKDYVQSLFAFGDIENQTDENWRVSSNVGDTFLFRSGSDLSNLYSKIWTFKNVKSSSKYQYYQAAYQGTDIKNDGAGPFLVLAQAIRVKTDQDVPVIVRASDAYGVASCKYLYGQHDADSPLWNGAYNVDGRFSVSSNGIYSVMAEDIFGNRTVKWISINNIDSSILQQPEVNQLSNRTSKLTGYAGASKTVNVSAGGKTYTTTAASDGTFEVSLPYQKADSKVSVYVSDETGRKSDTVTITVKRTGPNTPTVNEITNKATSISGKINDTTSKVVAFVGDDIVCVPKNGGKAIYEESAKYDTDRKIVQTTYEVSNGTYTLNIPNQYANTKVTLFAIDKIGRVSTAVNKTIKEVAPNRPVLYDICNAENQIYGRLPKAGKGGQTITITVDDQEYETTVDADGMFTCKIPGLKEGAEVYVTASDLVDGKQRTSIRNKQVVKGVKSYFAAKEEDSCISLKKVTTKSTVVKGTVDAVVDQILIKVGSKRYEAEVDGGGSYCLDLDETLEEGTSICIVLRNLDQELIEVKRSYVELAKPEKPELLNEQIDESTTTVKLYCEDKATAVAVLDGKKYTTSEAVPDRSGDGYVYKIKVKKTEAGKKYSVYMTNKAGNSGKLTGKVKKNQ